ncbi:MAG: xanthine dehydrogenase family protein molybdopterin-binding subunit [Phenylobacterium sp.]|jgi:isoquinoline 1-oxidoreductase beta subunit|uniref:xanthine dehydrogenase family protein molybdopterin-binding subunit n=1 Tax=Phenylobacterium sp. TaxID=1871053 RepID=UPI00217B9706|nr:molybdopterin cofactor-binding domain-containing protein [Phenylobacterium sp.]MCA3260095.1 xanthine dehydrogenase family protein molybdopterin-binding subunit [Rubrivivax sp.]MCA3757886.1 xanthine dehydrogenase family protein molybdopterin-binding subunit [Phenylobacterium sp.]
MTANVAPTRRVLLIGIAAGVARTAWADDTARDAVGFGPFLRIDAQGAVVVVAKHCEFGQGTHTGLAAVVAEELDADWSKVSVESAPADRTRYGNARLRGIQGTAESSSIADSWLQLRHAGAAARSLFVAAAARRWAVDPAGVTVVAGDVRHPPSGRRAGFGDLLAEAARLRPANPPQLKRPGDFRLLGRADLRRKDGQATATGATRYTMDVQAPGLLVAVVAHPQRLGARVASFDSAAALRLPGVVEVFAIPSGVAVVAKDTWSALRARDAVKVTWDLSRASRLDTAALAQRYARLAEAQEPTAPWVSFLAQGEGPWTGPASLVATYDFPYLAHAAMEPMNCVAQVSPERTRLTFASQAPTLDQLNVARRLGIPPDTVEIDVLPAGGSFGRRANLTSDYVVECATIAAHVGGDRPVKLVWTREDDFAAGRCRPLTHHRVEILAASDGYPKAWRHRVVTQSIMAGTLPPGTLDETSIEGVKNSPYLRSTPLVDARVMHVSADMPVQWWRSVDATHTAFVMEHTIDRLARAADVDPVAYRLELFRRAGDRRRTRALRLCARKAGWGAPLPPSVARGVAVHESFGTVVAQVAEVELTGGRPRVRRVVCVVDCGFAVLPDQVKAQMEGGIGYGLCAALSGEITVVEGVIQQRNFDDYQVLRMADAPRIETHIMPSAEAPSGVGEPATPVIAPAVANACLKLTGRPTSALPFAVAVPKDPARPSPA